MSSTVNVSQESSTLPASILARSQDVIYEMEEVFAGGKNRGQVLLLFVRQITEGLLEEYLCKAYDGMQWCFEFMADVRNKTAF